MDPTIQIALEMVNTAVRRSSASGDLLDGPAGLRAWLHEHRDVLGDPSDDVALRVSEFRDLRDGVRDVLAALLVGGPVPLDAVQRINAVSASVPAWPELDASDASSPVALEVHAAVGRTVAVLGTIARGAILLAGSAHRERLRRCPAPRCGRFFLEGRRGAIWCSPACGNRVRVARHHARRAALERTGS